MSAFEVWLKKGSISNNPPQQLPIVLQVLLSQVHRLRALMLLSKFLDLGQKAVNLSLSVGIFPYVLKLLQSPAAELRPVLVFIWAKLLAIDSSCQADLLKDNGYTYFIGILSMPEASMGVIANPSEHRAMCAFVLSVFCTNFPAGQAACLQNGLLPSLLPHLKDEDSLLRQWICVCFGQFWRGFPEAKTGAIRVKVGSAVASLLTDPVAEVRAAATFALGALLGGLKREETGVDPDQVIITYLLKTLSDASPIVRRELVIALSRSLSDYESKYVMTAIELIEEERTQAISTLDERQFSIKKGTSVVDRFKVAEAYTRKTLQKSLYSIVWKAMLSLSVDPHPSVSELGIFCVDKIMTKVLTTAGSSDHANFLIARNERLMGQISTPSSINTANIAILPQPSATNKTVTRNPSAVTVARKPSNNNPPIQRTASTSSFVSSLHKFFVGGMSQESYNMSPSSGLTQNRLLQRGRTSSMINISSLQLQANQTQIPLRSPSEEKLDSSPSPMIVNSDSVLLESEFFQWSCEYFKEPQMATNEVDDPGSIKFNERQWRKIRRNRIIAETDALYPFAGIHEEAY